MKLHIHSILRHSAAAALTLAVAGTSHAATINWVGDTSNDFMNAANWTSDTLPSLSADTWQVNGTGTQGNATLNVSSALTFAGTAGKIAFGASSGNMGLTGSDITLFQGTGDGILTAVASGNTTTIANNIILGNGSTATNSLSNSGTGLLKVTGNIVSGTGGTPGNQTLSFGSTDSQNGNYEVTGNISKGTNATALFLTKRGNGTLTLSGNNEVAQLGQNVAGSKIVIAGGTTNLKPATESLNNWGGGTMTAGTGPTVEVQTGATLNADYARTIRAKLSVTGGTINFQTTALRLDWGLTNTEVFNMTSGEVNFLNSSGSFGVNFANATGAQSGGTFTINGRGGDTANAQDLRINSSSFNASYAISGGTLDIKGSNSTNGHLKLFSDVAGVYTSTVTLSGTGKLVVRSSPGSATSGISGGNTDAKQILSLTGGTLVAGRINAANLRGSEAGTNGTIVNNGTTFAPGDVTANLLGRTNIVGSFTQTTGTLAFDLGGTTASTVFSEAASAGTFDNLVISSNFALNGGSLRINFVNGFESIITNLNTFTIVDVTGTSSFSGAFAALTTGNMTVDAYVGNTVVGSFTLDDNVNDLVLSNYQVIPEPSTWALLALSLTTLVVLRRRRQA